jgi:putative glutamine amidotransferase
MKALIGITTNYTDDSEALDKIGFGLRRQTGAIAINDYADALIQAGAVPVHLPTTGDPAVLEALLDRLDGLLISGGNDIDPLLYGQGPRPELDQIEPIRDQEEIFLFQQAMARHLPIFGICRGLQLINVAQGGSLYQDLPSQKGIHHAHSTAYPKDHASHRVDIEPGSFLDQLYHKPSLQVNSFHHQGVDQVGDQLKVAARADDGLVEALEWADDSQWVRAVQWHPEALRYSDPDMDRLFSTFVQACS